MLLFIFCKVFVLIPVCLQCCCACFVTVLSRRLSGLINSTDHPCNKGDFALVRDL